MPKAVIFAYGDLELDSAFALFSFDNERILQRKFFSKTPLCRQGLSDAEILSAFSETADEDIRDNVYVDEYDTHCQILKDLMYDLYSYQRKIEKHVEKLKNFRAVLADKIASSDEQNEKWRNQYQRAKGLIYSYNICLAYIKNLREKVNYEYKTRDAKIQSIYRKRFANRLKLARLGKNLSQFFLADKLGLTVAAYHNYENAKREPTLTNLIRLAKVLGVTPNWLLGFE